MTLQAELKAQKDELQRQREALQRQIDLFDEYKTRAMRDIVSASLAATSRSPACSADVISHSRSASDDADQHRGYHHQHQQQQQPVCDEARYSQQSTWSSRNVDGRTSRTRGVQQRSGATVSRRDTMPPIHLMSATNQVRSGPVQPQKLPLKLASVLDSGVARRSRWTSGSPAGVSSGRSPSEHGLDRHPVNEDPALTQRQYLGSTEDRSILSDETVSNGRTSSRRSVPGHQFDATESLRSSELGTFSGQAVRCDDEVSELGWFGGVSQTSSGLHHSGASTTVKYPSSPRPSTVMEESGRTSSVLSKSSSSAASLLPMKLAERPRPKSATSPTVQQRTNISTSSETPASVKSERQSSKSSCTSTVSTVQSRTSPADGLRPQRSNHSVTNINTAPPPRQRDERVIYF